MTAKGGINRGAPSDWRTELFWKENSVLRGDDSHPSRRAVLTVRPRREKTPIL